MKRSLAAMIISTAFISTVAFAKCDIPNLPDGSRFDSRLEQYRVVGYDRPDNNFFVIIQNQKSCEISNEIMSEDQLFEKFQISDELETGCVDGCD